MPRKATDTTTAEIEADAPMTYGESIEQKLDLMLEYMHRMERRDRLRTTGGLIRGLLGLIPLLLLLWTTWYFFQNGDEFIKQVTSEAVKQSAEYSQGSMMEQLQEYMNQQQGR